MTTAPFGKSNSGDVPAKVGPAVMTTTPAADVEQQSRRGQRQTGAMAALQQMTKLKEEQRITAIKKKLATHEGYCWC